MKTQTTYTQKQEGKNILLTLSAFLLLAWALPIYAQTPKICMEAIIQNCRAIKYIHNKIIYIIFMLL